MTTRRKPHAANPGARRKKAETGNSPRKADRPDTQYIEGFGPEYNKAVHEAAERYLNRRNERMAANKEETAAHETLLEIMTAQGITSYSYKGVEAHIDNTRKVKVKIAGKGGEGEDDDDAGEE